MARKSATASEKASSDTDSVINMLSSEMIKEFGADAVTSLDDSNSRIEHWCSTRNMVIDKVLSGGNADPCPLIPFGRQTEIAGLNGTGKTTLCAQIIAEAQKKNIMVVVSDTEDRIETGYWHQLGVDTSKILSARGSSLEDVFRKQIKFIKILREKAPERLVLMLWDSIASVGSNVLATSEDPMSEKSMMADPRILGQGMKSINQLISESNIGYIYTNHLYHKPAAFGDPYETWGGEKIKFFATVRLRLTHVGQIKEKDDNGNDQVIGSKIRISAKKNSMAPMRLTLDAALLGGKGFSNEYTVYEKAEELKIISKSGPWSTWKAGEEEIKFQGFRGFQQKVVEHPQYATLEAQVRERL